MATTKHRSPRNTRVFVAGERVQLNRNGLAGIRTRAIYLDKVTHPEADARKAALTGVQGAVTETTEWGGVTVRFDNRTTIRVMAADLTHVH